MCTVQSLYNKLCYNTDMDITSGLSHPFLEMGPGGHAIGKISGVLTKIGKFDIVLLYDVSIARLIQIIKLTFFLNI